MSIKLNNVCVLSKKLIGLLKIDFNHKMIKPRLFSSEVFKCPDGTGLFIDISRLEECDEILCFLRDNFFSKSPEVHLIGNDKPKPGSKEEAKEIEFHRNQILEECLKPSHSLSVRDPNRNGALVAVTVNQMHFKGRRTILYPPGSSSTPYSHLLNDLSQPADNLYHLYETDKVFYWYITTVSPPYQGFGLAKRLAQLCIELAVKNGAGAIKMNSMSEYTARIGEKMGYTTLRSIDYATFEFNGMFPYANNKKLLAEHSTARFMVRKL